MKRFALMLHSEFVKNGISAEIWLPSVFFCRFVKQTAYGLWKWVAYLDKFLIFPLVLIFRLRDRSLRKSDVRFHICDHGNAPYLKYLPGNRTGITCHDALAIRGALGYADAYTPASVFGKVFQWWIFYNLSRTKILAAVSLRTLNQLKELKSDHSNNQKDWKVIHNAFNDKFGVIELTERNQLLAQSGIHPEKPFLLHVGSNSIRKNRKLLLDLVKVLGDQWDGNICYAGEEIEETLICYAKSLNLQERLISIVEPNHATLVALYNACDAFVFPSFSEGFGWPLIEAQACGSPVIASNIEPMPEVCGDGALYADPNKPLEFARKFLLLKDQALRNEIISRGFRNSTRFDSKRMISSYMKLHDFDNLKVVKTSGVTYRSAIN